MRKDINTLKGWKLFGKYYGYPNCCITALMKGEQHKDNVFVGTGFLPCCSCSNKNPFEIVDIINTNRISPDKFTLFVETTKLDSLKWEYEKEFAKKVWSCSKGMIL